MRTPTLLLTALALISGGCATPPPAQRPAYPAKIVKGELRYPRLAIDNSIQGTTVLRLLIDRSGKLRKIGILKSSGSVLLDGAALESASRFTFEPARNRDLTPVPSIASLPVRFVKKSHLPQ